MFFMNYIGKFTGDIEKIKEIAKKTIIKDTFMMYLADAHYEKNVYHKKESEDSNHFYLTIYFTNANNLDIFSFLYHKIDQQVYYERNTLTNEDIKLIKKFSNQKQSNLKLVK